MVAVKKMKPGSKEDEINFKREAEFMMYKFFTKILRIRISKKNIRLFFIFKKTHTGNFKISRKLHKRIWSNLLASAKTLMTQY